MSTNRRVQYSIDIDAPVASVVETMLGAEGYRQWTTVFVEGSYYEGAWKQGERICFLAPGGDGMLSEIAEHRPLEFVSIRHIGVIANGVEDTDSDSVRQWAPAYENYHFQTTPAGTRVLVDQDATAESEQMMTDLWPKALQKLKRLCEAGCVD